MWITISYISWGISAVLAAWMLWDWFKTDSEYSEEVLTSSREGEIEAVSEKHRKSKGASMIDRHRNRWRKRTVTRVSLLRVLGPGHIWALGVGIVLVGEFTGWNFSADKGGALAALIVCWFVGLLYTSVAMIDSEVTSTVAAAGGQYAQAKHIVGPLMAFNVALFLVFAYTMLEVSDAILAGDTDRRREPATEGLTHNSFIVLCIVVLAWLNYRGVLMTLNVNFVVTALAYASIVILFFSVQPWSQGAVLKLGELVNAAERTALWLDRRHRRIPVRHLVLSRHRGNDAGGGRGALACPLAALRHHGGHDHAADRRGAHLVRLRKPAAVGVSWHHDLSRCRTRRKMTGSPILEFLLFWGTVLSAVASANGCINDAARAWFSLGRDRYLPTWFSAVHPKYRTPYRSILFLLPIALAFAFIADLNQAITFSILSGVLHYTFMSINIMMFRRKWP